MKASKSELVFEARMAFDAGDIRRGSAILHEIFKTDITYSPAWDLLHAALNRPEELGEFQLEFVSKYYPDQIDQFRPGAAQDAGKSGKNGPFRRVSLVSTQATGTVAAPVSPGASSVSEPGPGPDAGRTDTRQRPVERVEKPSASEKGGFFARIGRFFSRLSGRKPRETSKPGKQAAPDQDEGAAPGSGSKFAPISLKDLPAKDPMDAPVRDRKSRRPEAQPLLTKLHEEQFEIRLLIADDIQQTRDNIRKLLKFEPSVEVVGVASNGEEAIELALEHLPDVVLMDINMPGMDGLQALKTIREKLPGTQVIMLTVQDDPGYLREALQFGARDYLIKPPTIDELISTINKTHEIGRMERERLNRLHTAVEEAHEEEITDAQGFAVAVYSPKGGVGCTLLASNLAVAAQGPDRSVVLIDCDLQYGGVGLFFNEQARSSIVELAPRAGDMDRNLLRDAVVTHQDSGVRLVLAPNRPEQGEQVRGDQLAGLIGYLRRLYSVVVVDTGSNLDALTAEVLAACDQVVVVMTQDIPSINEVRQLLDFAPKIGLAEGKIALVLNQYHKRINITPEQISKNLRREFAAVVPLDNRTAIPSINRGVPFMMNAESRALPIGEAVQALLDRIVERQMVAV